MALEDGLQQSGIQDIVNSIPESQRPVRQWVGKASQAAGCEAMGCQTVYVNSTDSGLSGSVSSGSVFKASQAAVYVWLGLA